MLFYRSQSQFWSLFGIQRVEYILEIAVILITERFLRYFVFVYGDSTHLQILIRHQLLNMTSHGRLKRRKIRVSLLMCILRCSQGIFVLSAITILVFIVQTDSSIDVVKSLPKQTSVDYSTIVSIAQNRTYEPFYLTKPEFDSNSSRDMFYSRQLGDHFQFYVNDPEMLQGSIVVHRNATVHHSFDCGWQMDHTVFVGSEYVGAPRLKHLEQIVCPLLVPQSHTFQHFMDGVVPKLMQAFEVLQNPHIKVMIHRPWDKIILEILEAFNIGIDRILFYEDGYYKVTHLIDTCNTPPLHPELWIKARQIFTSHAQIAPVPQMQKIVILLTRAGSRNYGRKINNLPAVSDYLSHKFQHTLHIFRGSLNLNESVQLFSSAHLIVGIHGGAFYNIMFAPSATNVIEIMPITNNGDVVPKSLAHNIVWKMSAMLGQDYARLMERASNRYGDLTINITRLNHLIDRII